MAGSAYRAARRNWGQISAMATTLTAIVAVLLTGLSFTETRRQVSVAEQGQITDRYGKAVEQLAKQGPEQLQIRLGGIYALQRLAGDSPRDLPTIVAVLSSFVRSAAPVPPAGMDACPDAAPSTDVQAAVTVLSLFEPSTEVPDLRSTCLQRTRLYPTSTVRGLLAANFEGADLRGSSLDLLDLSEARFEGANLDRAAIRNSTIPWFALSDVHMSGADLFGSDLSTHCPQHTFPKVPMLDLSGVQMRNTILSNCELGSQIFRQTELSFATLRGANLQLADLSGSNLHSADFRGAKLQDADLRGAHLFEADLSGADLTGIKHDAYTQVTKVKTDSSTKGKWW
ncbi:pentapeptide repeat-containing protein [Pseudonocardiaceae bacterium YIM PH 21723]|nr:pentapeptide repeat-containing protein [Pseudonocardiaceae bacterium YIM PH 21723]